MREISEVLADKIDSLEKMEAVKEEIPGVFEYHLGITTILTDDNWWTARDYLRFATGYWETPTGINTLANNLPDVNDDSFFGTLHVAKHEGVALVAFAETEAKRKRDIFTRMKYGRYLTKYFSNIDNEEVKQMVSRFDYDHNDVVVHFGETEEEFIRAINEGPDESCMANFSYDGHVHPAAVYASGDIKVAWLEDGDRRVVARTLINKKTGKFSRVYGDHGRLMPALNDQGYSQEVGALVGCKLRKIENRRGSGYIMAYVDAGVGSGGGNLYVTDEGDHWLLNDNDEGTSTYVGYDNNGLTDSNDGLTYSESGMSCDHCGDGMDGDDSTYSEYHDYYICTQCAANNYTYAMTSRYGRDWVRNSQVTIVDATGEGVADDYLEEYAERNNLVYAEGRVEYISSDDAVECVDGGWQHTDDCTEVGTSSTTGETLYAEDGYIRRYPGEFYVDTNGGVFFEESEEVETWLEELDDPDVTEEDGFDSYAFTRKDMVGRMVSEIVCYPADHKFPTEVVCHPQVVVPGTTFRVGDRVRVVQITMPLSAADRDDELMGAEGEVVNCGQGNFVVKFSLPSGTYTLYTETDNVVKVCHVIDDPAPAVKKSWQQVYQDMQAAGIKFEHLNSFGGWTQQWCGFYKTQDRYRIDSTQTPPDNWRDTYLKAQADGIEFSWSGGTPTTWAFGSSFRLYQFYAATQQERIAA